MRRPGEVMRKQGVGHVVSDAWDFFKIITFDCQRGGALVHGDRGIFEPCERSKLLFISKQS